MTPPIPIVPHVAAIDLMVGASLRTLPAPASRLLEDPRILGIGTWVQVDSRNSCTACSGAVVYLAGTVALPDTASEAEGQDGETGHDGETGRSRETVRILRDQEVLTSGIPGLVEGVLALTQDMSGRIVPRSVVDALADDDGETRYLQVIYQRGGIAVTVDSLDSELDWVLSDAGFDPYDLEGADLDPGLFDPAKICTLLVAPPATAHARIALPTSIARDLAAYERILHAIAPCTASLIRLEAPGSDALRHLFDAK